MARQSSRDNFKQIGKQIIKISSNRRRADRPSAIEAGRWARRGGRDRLGKTRSLRRTRRARTFGRQSGGIEARPRRRITYPLGAESFAQGPAGPQGRSLRRNSRLFAAARSPTGLRSTCAKLVPSRRSTWRRVRRCAAPQAKSPRRGASATAAALARVEGEARTGLQAWGRVRACGPWPETCRRAPRESARATAAAGPGAPVARRRRRCARRPPGRDARRPPARG